MRFSWKSTFFAILIPGLFFQVQGYGPRIPLNPRIEIKFPVEFQRRRVEFQRRRVEFQHRRVEFQHLRVESRGWDVGTLGRWDVGLQIPGMLGRWAQIPGTLGPIPGTLGRWDVGTLGRWDVGTLGLKFPGRWDVGRDVGTLELKFNVSTLDFKSKFQTKLYQ